MQVQVWERKPFATVGYGSEGKPRCVALDNSDARVFAVWNAAVEGRDWQAR